MNGKEQMQSIRENQLENLVIQLIYDFQQLLESFYIQQLKRAMRKRTKKKQ